MSKHKAIPKKKRLAVYEKFNHRCAYCGWGLDYCLIFFLIYKFLHLAFSYPSFRFILFDAYKIS